MSDSSVFTPCFFGSYSAIIGRMGVLCKKKKGEGKKNDERFIVERSTKFHKYAVYATEDVGLTNARCESQVDSSRLRVRWTRPRLRDERAIPRFESFESKTYARTSLNNSKRWRRWRRQRRWQANNAGPFLDYELIEKHASRDLYSTTSSIISRREIRARVSPRIGDRTDRCI